VRRYLAIHLTELQAWPAFYSASRNPTALGLEHAEKMLLGAHIRADGGLEAVAEQRPGALDLADCYREVEGSWSRGIGSGT
jgi:hypothetical protein